MIKDLLKEVCKKVYQKNLERDLRTLIAPAYDLSYEFVTKSLNKSREICRIILQNLYIKKKVEYHLEDEEIDLIVNEAYLEVQMAFVQAG